jgi:hypothetical protein
MHRQPAGGGLGALQLAGALLQLGAGLAALLAAL